MSARSLRGGVVAALMATVLGGGAATAADESGSADSCAAANTQPENWSERSGSVHNSWDLTDWYSHSTPANQRTITLTFSNDNVDLQVWTGDCAALLCASATPTWDQCTVPGAGRVKIRVVYPTPAAGVGVSGYTLRVQVPPECSDGYDNDGDALSDHPFDPDCTDPTDSSESGPAPAACGDRVDNDGDGRIDYPLDPGCTAADDTNEVDDSTGGCSPTAPGVVVCLTPGSVFLSQSVALVSLQPTTSHAVVGYVGRYLFTLPLGIEVTLPCVTVTLDGSADLCTTAGGRFVDRIATLVDTTVSEYAVVPGPAIATVRVCNATLTATVLGLGVNQAPAFALC